MCVFVDEIQVSDTSIFARRPVPGDDRQILVYSMKVYSDEPTAMILPLPVAPGADEAAIRFINLSDYETFFADMRIAVGREALEVAAAGEACFEDRSLPVHQVGDFEASFVPGLADFKRLDRRFQLPDNVWDQMPDYHDYGFAVFQLNPVAQLFSESKIIHPMAFEFRSRDRERLFFPTVHVHDGRFHDQAWFDHTLFMQFETDDVVRSRITATHNSMYQGNETEDTIVGDFPPSENPEEPDSPNALDANRVDSDPVALVDVFSPSYGKHFVYSPGNAVNHMNTELSAGTIDPDRRICGLTAKTRLKNQDTWV